MLSRPSDNGHTSFEDIPEIIEFTKQINSCKE